VAGFAFAGGELAYSYAIQALLHPGTLPGGIVAAFLQSLQLIGFVVLPLLLLLFPDGRLPTRRWKPLAWAAVACPLLMWPALFLTPGLMLDGVPASRNPPGLQALEGANSWIRSSSPGPSSSCSPWRRCWFGFVAPGASSANS
jgi:two-component system, NarL family, sensor kinase